MRSKTITSAQLGELEAKKRASTAQLLFKCARLLNERAIRTVRERTGRPVRVAHTLLLPHIDFEGVRSTELARRLGVSKQAVGQLVDELVEMRIVERVADPDDGRAKLVRFSARGRRSILDGLGVLGEIERDMEAALGRSAFAALHAALERLLAELEAGE